MKISTEERFWRKVIVLGSDDCWEWTGSRSRKGYGSFWYNEKVGKSSRYSLEQKIGRELVSGEFACHTCDNPPCVNPEHLFVGDNSINQQDAVSKGRWSSGNVRKTHCKRNHEFTDENTRINPRGQRVCRRCDKDIQAERRERRKNGHMVH